MPSANQVARQRHQVYLRDGGRCAYCSRELLASEASADHLVPRSRGGPNHVDNLLLACVECNQTRDDLDVHHWLELCRGQGRPLDEALIAAALNRLRSSGAFTVRVAAAVELRRRGLSLAEVRACFPDWPFAWTVADICARYAEVEATAAADFDALERAVEAARFSHPTRASFALGFALRLSSRRQARAAFLIWSGQAEEARRRYRDELLKRAFLPAALPRAPA